MQQIYPPTPRRPHSKTLLRLPSITHGLNANEVDGLEAVDKDGRLQQPQPVGTTTSSLDTAHAPVNDSTPDQNSATSPAILRPISSHPPAMLALHQATENTFRVRFPKYPPWTIQRLAELMLEPQRGNRTLGSFLRSLEVTLSASSSTTAFPSNEALLAGSGTIISMQGGGELPATSSTGLSQSMQIASISSNVDTSSDEAIGGALLTPISWLQTRAVGETHGRRERIGASQLQSDSAAGKHISAVSDFDEQYGRMDGDTRGIYEDGEQELAIQSELPAGNSERVNHEHREASLPMTQQSSAQASSEGGAAVSQGELLQMEQSSDNDSSTIDTGGTVAPIQGDHTASVGSEEAVRPDDEEHPHARGPSEIGIEDTGPQPSIHPLQSSAIASKQDPHSPPPGPPSPHSMDQPSTSGKDGICGETDTTTSSLIIPAPSGMSTRPSLQYRHSNSKINVGGFNVEKALGRHITQPAQDPSREPGRAELAIQGLERHRENDRDHHTANGGDASGKKESAASTDAEERERRRERERERSHERKMAGRRTSATRDFRQGSSSHRTRSRSLSPARELSKELDRGRKSAFNGEDTTDPRQASSQSEHTACGARVYERGDQDAEGSDEMEGVEKTG